MQINNWLRLSVPIFILLSLFNNINHAKQVNSFNLLFPTSYHQIKGHARQIVITSGGCYIWESTQSSIIKVTGTHHGLVPSQTATKNPSCHSNGIVELVHQGQYPSSVYITAQDKTSTDITSIPVRIRDLKKISIFTKSRIMNIKEIQNLQIYGFDAQNNTFTSLEGLRFKWIITQINQRSRQTGLIQKIPLSQSSLYLPLDTRKKLETQDKVQSDLLIVRALKVGKINVKVRCIQPNYQLITDQITLYIQQKFQISPSLPINLLIGSRYKYNLLTPSGFTISLPSPNYNIKLSDPSFTISNNLQLKAPNQQKQVQLKISDYRTQPPYQQSVKIYVYQPDSIQLLINQQIIINQQVKYQINFYHKKLLLKGQLDLNLLQVRVIDQGNSIMLIDRQNNKIIGNSKGIAKLYVSYNGLSVQKRITVTTPLKLLSKNNNNNKIILPIDQIYQISIIGGSGLYKYQHKHNPKLQQQSILILSSNGLITTRKQGIADIVVIDQKNNNNRLNIRVYVRRMRNIHSIEEIKEFNVKQQGSLYITAQPISDVQGQQFVQCNDALLRGISLVNADNTNQIATVPLSIININPINQQTLQQLHTLSHPSSHSSISQSNQQISKLLKSRKTINTQQLTKQLTMYIRYGQITKSDLDKIILDMQNYGLCAKLLIKPTASFDGVVRVTKHKVLVDQSSKYGEQIMRVRVYDKLVNNIVGLNDKYNQIAMTPLSSFKWKTTGGPYGWNSQQDIEVYLNDIKMNPRMTKTRQDYLYPTIKCPTAQKTQYTIKYKNIANSKLLRPVQQQQQIVVDCSFPDMLRIGLPQKKTTNTNINSNKNNDDYTMRYILSSQSNSSIYILPGQCFRISLQPVYLPGISGRQLVQHYNNASNVQYQFIGLKYGKIQQITPSNNNNNIRVFTYSNKNTRQQDSNKIQTITIISSQIYDPITHTFIKYPQPIKHKLSIIPIKQLKISNINQQQGIQLPNMANSQYILQLYSQPSSQSQSYQLQSQNNKRYSLKYDDSIIKCNKIQNNKIKIQPSTNIQKSTVSNIKIIDQFAIGNPQISIPVRIWNVNGVDLWVDRIDLLGNSRVIADSQLTRYNDNRNINSNRYKYIHYTNINRNILKQKTWLLDGQQFIAIVDVYTINNNISQNRRQPIANLDPYLIQLTIDQLPKGNLKQIYRNYDPINKVIVILFRMPKVLEQSHKITTSSSQIHNKYRLTASLRHRNNQILLSNPTTIQIHEPIQLLGSSGTLPIQQFDISQGNRVITNKIDSYAYIMQSCSTILDIKGGPSQIKTKIISNPGQGTYYNVIKLSQRRYRVQTIKHIENGKKNNKGLVINGKQNNLLTILVYLEKEQGRLSNEQLVNIRCLVLIQPISDIRISGIDKILNNKQVRYLATFEQQRDNNKIIKQQCQLKYKWLTSSPKINNKQLIQITSDITKQGINVQSINIQNQQQVNTISKNSQAELTVVVYSNKNRQIGRNTKKIVVIVEDIVNVVNQGNVNYQRNNDLVVNSKQILLIPSDSGLKLNNNLIIQQISPCDRSDSTLSISNQNQLITSSLPSQFPQLVKLQSRNIGSNRQKYVIPSFINVQVADICNVVIGNIDGSITVTPTHTSSDNQFTNFYLTDCLGRKFLHYNYKNIEYKLTVTDPNIISASISNTNQGVINLQGHQVGHSQLILQVILNGVIKAKDIVPVYVNTFIRPSKPISVHIGDIINFKGPQKSNSQQKWSTADSKIVKINSRNGQALAAGVGQTYVKYGAMSTPLSVIKVNDLIKRRNNQQNKLNGYDYQLVFQGKKYPVNLQDSSYIKQQLDWKCQIIGKQSSFLKATATRIRQNNKQYIRCKVQKITGAPTIQTSIKNIGLKVIAENRNVGFTFSKDFEQQLQFFVILSERFINPRDPKFKKQKNTYMIIIQTNQRLDFYQRGGKQEWIINSEFNGIRQIISLDLSHYRSGQWRIAITNPKTKQTDQVIISNKLSVEQIEQSKTTQTSSQIEQKQGWKWTDILVIFMAINFLLILGYQVFLNRSQAGNHLKAY